MAGDGARSEAFRAYVGRRGAELWARAVLLAAGQQAVAQQLLAGALATTYAGWGPDSDDVVETHLAVRAMTRAAGEPTPAGEPHEVVADGVPDDAQQTWARLRSLDPAARAALVASVLGDVGDHRDLGDHRDVGIHRDVSDVRPLAATLERRVRDVRADLARGLGAWPAGTPRESIAAALATAGAAAAAAGGPPDPGLLDAAMRGPAASGRRRGFGRPGRLAVLIVVVVALLGALAGARQLATSAPEPAPTPTPDVATAQGTLQERVVSLADLPDGAPARLARYVTGSGPAGWTFVDTAGRVPLPAALTAVVLGSSPRGTFLLLASGSGPPQTGVVPARIVLIGPDRSVRSIADDLIGYGWAAPSGDYLAYLQLTPPASSATSEPPKQSVVVVRVADGTEVARRSTPGMSGLAWLGETLVVGEGGVLQTWRAGEDWRGHPLPALFGGPTSVGGVALLQRVGPGTADCLRRWTPAGGLVEQPLWCGDELAMSWGGSPQGRFVLVMRKPSASASSEGFRWGAVAAASGRFAPFELPDGFFPFGGMAAIDSTWEDEDHVLLTGGEPGRGAGPGATGIRCSARTGACERAALPAELAGR